MPGPNFPTSIGGWAIWLVCTAAIIGLVFLGIQASGIIIPTLVYQGLCIVVVAVVIILLIRFIQWFSGQTS